MKDRSKSKSHVNLIILASILLLSMFCMPVYGWYNYYPQNPNFTSDISSWTAEHHLTNGVVTYNINGYENGCCYLYCPSLSSGWVSVSQTFDFKNSSYLEFYAQGVSSHYYHYLQVLIDGNFITNANGVQIGSYTLFNISIPLGYRSGSHTLKFYSVADSNGRPDFYLDSIVLKTADNPYNVTGNISSSAGLFEYGKTGWYSITMEHAGTYTYYVDVYGLNSTEYTFLNTYSLNNTESGYNILEITAPPESSGYKKLYAVLRNANNETYGNTTDSLVNSANSYFYFDPDIINQNESTHLYYRSGYSYNTKIVDDFTLIRGVLSSIFNVRRFVYPNDEDSLEYIKYSTIDQSGIYGTGLYSGDDLNRSERLMWASYEINGSYVGPNAPQYDPEKSGRSPAQESEYSSNTPGVPENYNLPSYPHTHSPSSDDDGDNQPEAGDNPNYPSNENNNYSSSHYNNENGTWEYNNDTGSGDGFYPVDVPGNTSVDTSKFQGFYEYVDGVYAPLNNSVNGFLSFVLSPVVQLGGYINQTKEYFLNSTTNLINENVVTECVVPVFTNLPPIIIELIVFGLILSIIGLLIRGG